MFMYVSLLVLLLYSDACIGESIWTFMLGLMENAVYGGRVDNEYDMMVLQSFLKQFFNTRVINGKVGLCHCHVFYTLIVAMFLM